MDARRALRLGASLKLDTVGVEVAQRLDAAGVEAIFIKGAPLAERLYPDMAFRPYDDIDLLVAPYAFEQARRTLRDLDFEIAADADYAEPWIRRRDGATVDLHRSLPGLEAGPELVWDELSRRTRPVQLAGQEVQALDDEALALLVALHAAHHGPAGGKALEDLQRGLDHLDLPAWQAAAGMAERLEGTPAFAAGLRLLPDGGALAERLGLSGTLTPGVALLSSSPPPVAPGLLRFSETEGLKAKSALLGRELVPTAAFMRATSRLARRGRPGLAASYALRPLWLLWRLPPAALALRRARRAAR